MKATRPDGEVPVIASHRDAFSDLLAGGGTIVQRAVETLDRLNQVLSDDNIKTLTATMTDLHAVTAELNARKSMIADAQKALQSADVAITQIGVLAKSSDGLINGDAKRSLNRLADAAGEIQETSKALHVTLNKLQGPSSDFATQALPKLSTEIESLQRATGHLDQLIGDIQANPRSALLKAPAKEIEIKP